MILLFSLDIQTIYKYNLQLQHHISSTVGWVFTFRLNIWKW